MSNPVTQHDLKIYASQRLTDTPDGGGRMTNQALTGAENELFAPISDVDRVIGAFDARLVYPALLRDDKQALYGANVIVSERPSDPSQSILIMAADYYGQERADFMERVESYRVPITETRMTLLGTARKGSRMVQTYQRENAPLPLVGETFALRDTVNGAYVYEFFKVEKIYDEVRAFEDDRGEFTRRVLKITTTQTLSRDFVGLENASRYGDKPTVRVLDTQVSDNAKYYGIKPLSRAASVGDSKIFVPSIDEQLVPVSTVETALTDSTAQGRECWIKTAPKKQVLKLSGSVYGTKTLYLNASVLPGSVEMNGFTDNGEGTLVNNNDSSWQISVDYARGCLKGWFSQYDLSISAVPAVKVQQAASFAYLTVNEINVGTEWAFAPLRPRPAVCSVQVSFMSGGQWYDLNAFANGALYDAQGVSCGEVTDNGSVSVSLPAVPDVGSQMIVTWAGRDTYKAFDGKDAGGAIEPQNMDTRLRFNLTANIKPSSLILSWTGGGASDDGKGKISGDVSGSVNYATGEVVINAPVSGTIDTLFEVYSQAPQTRAVQVADGNSEMSLIAGALQKGSLKIEITPALKTASGYTCYSGVLLATTV